MGRFVVPETVNIYEDETARNGNFITIKSKMGIGDTRRVDDDLYVFDDQGNAKVTMGRYQIALLKVNIVGWGGPDYVGVALTPTNIERLDPNEPFHKRVIEEISARNTERQSPDPKLADESSAGESLTAPMTTISTTAGEAASVALGS